MRFLIALALASLAGAATAPPSVTFNKDVLPVLQKNCQNCHRPGEAAPMSFLDYQHTRPWAKAIKTAVLSKQMPPWFADPHFGIFANAPHLTQAEVETLVAWAETGAKEGDSREAARPAAFTEGWQIGKPDYVLEMPKEYAVPATGTIDYQYILVPTGFSEDRWIQSAEARPGNKALVHHIIAFVVEPNNPILKQLKPGEPFVPQHGMNLNLTAAVAGYAPGMVPQVLQPGQAKFVPAGSAVVLQMHYTANGTAGTDRSRVGMIFAKEPPQEKVITLAAANNSFVIPPGDSAYRVDSKIQLQHDSKLVNFLPHMHFRGKSFEYRAVYPGGEKETLLSVPRYDFNWQLTYYLAQQKVLPAGTVIECTAYFDNSPNNKFNPDPGKEVRFGEQTWEEMMIGFFDVAVPTDVTVMDLVRPKKRPAAQTSGGL